MVGGRQSCNNRAFELFAQPHGARRRRIISNQANGAVDTTQGQYVEDRDRLSSALRFVSRICSFIIYMLLWCLTYLNVLNAYGAYGAFNALQRNELLNWVSNGQGTSLNDKIALPRWNQGLTRRSSHSIPSNHIHASCKSLF